MLFLGKMSLVVMPFVFVVMIPQTKWLEMSLGVVMLWEMSWAAALVTASVL